MAKSLDLHIDQGSDFVAILPAVTRADNTVLNLTGFTPRALLRRSYATQYAVQMLAEVSNATGGVITLSLTNEETAGLVDRYYGIGTRWVYDVVIEDANNVITKVFEGQAFVNPAITSKPNTTLLTPYLPDDFGGI